MIARPELNRIPADAHSREVADIIEMVAAGDMISAITIAKRAGFGLVVENAIRRSMK